MSDDSIEKPSEESKERESSGFTRRSILQASLALGAGAWGLSKAFADEEPTMAPAPHSTAGYPMKKMGILGAVKDPYPGFYLRNFYRGKPVPKDVKEIAKIKGWPEPDVYYEIHSIDKEVEIAPGIMFPGWIYTMHKDGTQVIEDKIEKLGGIPGPTLRCNEGEEVLIKFVNQGSHPHTIHFHGVHEHEFDGAFPKQFVNPRETFWYRFRAEPYGLHLYHCHSNPLKRHVHKGLYGVFIVDPDPRKGKRTPVGKDPDGIPQEYVMMLNGFDTNFDGDNEVYAVNSATNYYTGDRAIVVKKNKLVRLYVVNITEFDPINSVHLHANFFYAIKTGTRVLKWGNANVMERNKHRFEFTDTLMFCQAERAILEFKMPYTGDYMFHAHQSEFAELGWMSIIRVVD